MNTRFPQQERRSERPGPTWELVSGHVLSDGSEVLVLKMPTGETFCEYAEALAPFRGCWHSYYKGFPKRGFVSRESCIEDAERIAGHSLTVRSFQQFTSTEGA